MDKRDDIDLEPRLSLEETEKILKNVFQAVGIETPVNCMEILRRREEKKNL